MKYLVISRGGSLVHGAKKENLERAKEMLQKGLDSGKVESCYGIVSGGTVWVINSDSHASLARGLKAFNRSGEHRLEVIPILDGIGVLDAHIAGK